MALSDAQLLERTRLRIDKITEDGAQSYTIAGRTVTKLKLLEDLWAQVRVLERRIATALRGGAFPVRFGGPQS